MPDSWTLVQPIHGLKVWSVQAMRVRSAMLRLLLGYRRRSR